MGALPFYPLDCPLRVFFPYLKCLLPDQFPSLSSVHLTPRRPSLETFLSHVTALSPFHLLAPFHHSASPQFPRSP